MTRRRLPIGIQTFREIRQTNCYYVDKPAYIRRLASSVGRCQRASSEAGWSRL